MASPRTSAICTRLTMQRHSRMVLQPWIRPPTLTECLCPSRPPFLSKPLSLGRAFSSAPSSSPPQQTRSSFRRALSFVFRGFFFSAIGYGLVLVHATHPIWKDLDTGALFVQQAEKKRHHNAELDYRPTTADAQALEAELDAHPFVQQYLRKRFRHELRPQLRVPPFIGRHSLLASTLAGPGLMAIPPRQWTGVVGEDGQEKPLSDEIVQIWHVGSGLCGHAGIVHGGFVATMLDEAMARCCFPALPLRMGVTAYLHIDYRAPTPADSFIVVHAKTVRVEGRKAWVQARLETLPPATGDKAGSKPVILAEGESLFVGFRDYGLGKYIPETNM